MSDIEPPLIDERPNSLPLFAPEQTWIATRTRHNITNSEEQFLEVADLLLEQVQLNSTHLFRADILYDSSGKLQTLSEKEATLSSTVRKPQDDHGEGSQSGESTVSVRDAPNLENFECQRTVMRRLIPRKPQLDSPLEQSCFTYRSINCPDRERGDEILVVYIPHCTDSESMPWYHPKVAGVAYRFTPTSDASADLSLYYWPFSNISTPLPDRLHRTLESLLRTMVRLLKLPSKCTQINSNQDKQGSDRSEGITNANIACISLTAASLKDTILPQHTVQNTYTRLKQTYASDLISRWIEKTEPSKHVFEDLSIAAFLIELWNHTYGAPASFTGFVDIACGNGVLVYVLIKEGWKGFGFDARRRKTWEVLGIDDHLEEKVCIPQPFINAVDDKGLEDLAIHNGIFPAGTFIISNHADELTCWTPILAKLSNPDSPLPFLAIPCCSHSLDGSKRRYTAKDIPAMNTTKPPSSSSKTDAPEIDEDSQPATGDLKSLRAAKQKAHAHADDKSMYACLTRKAASLALEFGSHVELTLMRIPSTRNIGIVGNRKDVGDQLAQVGSDSKIWDSNEETEYAGVEEVIRRECQGTGGIEMSAQTWIEKAKKLQVGQGRGKVNLKASRVIGGNV